MKPNVLILKFNGHIAEIGLKEFYLVTKLKGYKFPLLNLEGKKECSLINAFFFSHDEYITRRDIERTFKGLENEKESVNVKLVNLYIYKLS